MNTAQVTACQPGICVKNICQLHRHDSKPCVLPMSINPCSRILISLREKPSFGLKCQHILRPRKPLHICLAGGKGMMGNNDEVLHSLLSYCLVCYCYCYCYYIRNVYGKLAYNAFYEKLGCCVSDFMFLIFFVRNQELTMQICN